MPNALDFPHRRRLRSKTRLKAPSFSPVRKCAFPDRLFTKTTSGELAVGRPRFPLFLSLAYPMAVFLVVGVGLWAWERVYRLFSHLPGSPTMHLALWVALLAVLTFAAAAGVACRLSHGQFYGNSPVFTLAGLIALGLAVSLGRGASALWASVVLVSAIGILSHLRQKGHCAAKSPRLG